MIPPNRIDVHFHIIPEFYQQAVKAAGLGPARRAGYPPYSPDLGTELMDANGTLLALTSVAPPGVEFLDRGQAKTMARKLNEHATELGVRYSGRYGAFSIIPMKNIEDAVAEIEFCLGTLKHQGVCLFSNYDGKFLGNSDFTPVMDALNKYEAVCFIHPTLHRSSRAFTVDLPAFVIEYPFETTRAAAGLIFSGTLERFPNIEFILAHAGGTLPYLAWRLGATPQIDPTLPQRPRAKFEAALKHFWYENALSCGAAAMATLKTVADPGKILFGSDWPYVQARLVSEEIATHEIAGLHSEAERIAIDRGNAATLFPNLLKSK